jgi:hypothetical protein
MVDIINMKVNLMEVNEETLEEKEVMEVVVKVIRVNNYSDSNCYYYGKLGHMANNYYQREHDA